MQSKLDSERQRLHVFIPVCNNIYYIRRGTRREKEGGEGNKKGPLNITSCLSYAGYRCNCIYMHTHDRHEGRARNI